MTGKSKYIIPSNQVMRESLKGSIKKKQSNQIKDLSKNQLSVEGAILQRDFHEKQKRNLSKEPDPMQDYVANFSDAADIINVKSADDSGGVNKMMGFASAI